VQYLGFISTVAKNLGIKDPMTVDTAIKTMLKQTVDDRHNAGEISDSAASALDKQIDAGNVAPLIFGQSQAGQGDSGASGSDARNPSDNSQQQGDSSNTSPAPTETPDGGYDYGY
jgi:hypothetical protein